MNTIQRFQYSKSLEASSQCSGSGSGSKNKRFGFETYCRPDLDTEHKRDDSRNTANKKNGTLFCFLDTAHDGWPAVSGTLEHRAEDPADADVLGLL